MGVIKLTNSLRPSKRGNFSRNRGHLLNIDHPGEAGGELQVGLAGDGRVLDHALVDLEDLVHLTVTITEYLCM